MATLTGTSGNDTLTGTSSADTLVGSAGNDFYDGAGGSDTLDLRATSTATIVDFTDGTISGGFTGSFTSIERVLAGNGNDHLIGGAGAQNLSGRAGADTLEGGAGNDWLWGGGGSLENQYVFRETGTANADQVGDFISGADKIVLDGSVMSALGAEGNFAAGDARFVVNTSGLAQDASDRVIYQTDTRQIWYDPDGDGGAARQLIATLQSGATLTATDIVVAGAGTPPPGGTNGTEGDDTLVGTAGDDTINGLGGNDSISGLDGHDSLSGGDGNDSLDGGANSDTLDGGLGNDTYFVTFAHEGTIAPDQIIDAGGIDTVVALSAGLHSSWTLGSGLENLEVYGTNGTGNELDNFIRNNEAGGPGVRTLNGMGGDDTLIGASDDSELFLFTGDYGNDVVDGGEGTGGELQIGDSSAVLVDFRSGIATGGGPGGSGSVSFTNVALASGGDFNDTLIGAVQAVGLSGNGGNDVLNGGAGSQALIGGDGSDSFVFDQAPGSVNADHVNDFSSGVDEMHLDATAMPQLGASGNFSAGDARFFAASGATAGHDADDRVVYDTSTGNLYYDPDGSGATAAQLLGTILLAGAAAPLVATDIAVDNGGSAPGDQHVVGTPGDDNLAGGSGNDTIEGLGGLDTLNGAGGNDLLAGGNGWDTLTGGAGQDTFAFAEFGSGMNDAITDFVSGTDTLQLDAAAFTAIGASGRFTAGDGRFFAAPGASAGHDADDRLIYDTTSGILYYDANGNGSGGEARVAILQGAPSLAATDIVVTNGASSGAINGTSGDDTLVGTPGNDTINGLGGNDSISGLAGDDSLSGGDGNDTLDGGAGADTVDGGFGDDTYFFNPADGADVVNDAGGIDTAIVSEDDVITIWNLQPGLENLTLHSSGFFIVGEGNELDNVLRNEGNRASEGYLDGADGNDTLIGGPYFTFQSGSGDYGHDFVDGAGDNGTLFVGNRSATVVDFRAGTVVGGGTSGTGNVDFVNINRVLGSDFNDQFFANDAGNFAYGGAGDDTFMGGAGNDTFSDDDVLAYDGAEVFGGVAVGADQLFGGAGDDRLIINRGDDVVDAGEGNDTIAINIGFYLAGEGYTYGNDTIDGGSGIDTLSVLFAHPVSVNLGAGTMTGGGVDGSGTAVLISIENFDTTRGFGGSHHLVGSAVGNVLTTRDGDDTLNGAGGNDTLGAGAGADHFEFDQLGAANADHVTSFESGIDKVDLDATVMTALGASGNFATDDARFFAAAGATSGHDADDRIVYNTNTGQLFYDADGNAAGAAQLIATLDGAPALVATDIAVAAESPSGGQEFDGTAGNDTLTGGPGDDTLLGFAGSDSLAGDAGDDLLDGGNGVDTLSGGAGIDTFRMSSTPTSGNADRVSDFASGTDKVLLAGESAIGLGPTGAFSPNDGRFFAGAGASAAHDADDRVIYDSSTGNLWFDSDGTGESAAQLLATLQAGAVLSASDIVVDHDWLGAAITGTAAGDSLLGSSGADLIDGLDGNDTLDGGGGFSDSLYGGNGDDVLRNGSEFFGQAGNDTMVSAQGGYFFESDFEGTSYGNDVIDGGSAPSAWIRYDVYDSVQSGVTIDLAAGTAHGGGLNGTGSATLANVDHARGSPFADLIIGSDADNQLFGGDGDDTLDGGAGSDFLSGGAGADSYIFSATPGTGARASIGGGDFVSGTDTIHLDASVMPALGASGRLSVDDPRFYAAPNANAGHDADDRIIYDTNGLLYYDPDGSGDAAAQRIVFVFTDLSATDIVVDNGSEPPPPPPGNTVNGTSGSDTLNGTGENDTLNGLGGNDTLIGSGGTDFYDGGAGSDTLDLRATSTATAVSFAAETISGGFSGTFANIERVLAGNGSDSLVGGSGAQNLSGRAGNDTVEGGAGNDWLWGGGSEVDTFVFREAGSSNADDVGDFTGGVDRIALDNATMAALGADGAFAGGDGRFFASAGASAGHDGDDRVIYNTSTGQLYYDDDGSGAHAAQLIATLHGAPTLAAAEITVI